MRGELYDTRFLFHLTSNILLTFLWFYCWRCTSLQDYMMPNDRDTTKKWASLHSTGISNAITIFPAFALTWNSRLQGSSTSSSLSAMWLPTSPSGVPGATKWLMVTVRAAARFLQTSPLGDDQRGLCPSPLLLYTTRRDLRYSLATRGCENPHVQTKCKNLRNAWTSISFQE